MADHQTLQVKKKPATDAIRLARRGNNVSKSVAKNKADTAARNNRNNPHFYTQQQKQQQKIAERKTGFAASAAVPYFNPASAAGVVDGGSYFVTSNETSLAKAAASKAALNAAVAAGARNGAGAAISRAQQAFQDASEYEGDFVARSRLADLQVETTKEILPKPIAPPPEDSLDFQWRKKWRQQLEASDGPGIDFGELEDEIQDPNTRPPPQPSLSQFIGLDEGEAEAGDDAKSRNVNVRVQQRASAPVQPVSVLEPPLPVVKLLRQVSAEAKAGHITTSQKERIKRILGSMITAHASATAAAAAAQNPSPFVAPVTAVAGNTSLFTSSAADRAAYLKPAKKSLPLVAKGAFRASGSARGGDRGDRDRDSKKEKPAPTPIASASGAGRAPNANANDLSTDAAPAAAAAANANSGKKNAKASAGDAEVPGLIPLLRQVSDVEKKSFITPQMKAQLQQLIRGGVRRPNVSSLFGDDLDREEPVDFVLDSDAIRRRIPKPKPVVVSAAERSAAAAAAGRARAAALAISSGADEKQRSGAALTDDELGASIEFMELDPDAPKFDGRRMLPLSRDTLPILYSCFDPRTFLIASCVNRMWWRAAAHYKWMYLFQRRRAQLSPAVSPIGGTYDGADYAEFYRTWSRFFLSTRYPPSAAAAASTAIAVPTFCPTLPIMFMWAEQRKSTAASAAAAAAAAAATTDDARAASKDDEPVAYSHDLWLLVAQLSLNRIELFRFDRAEQLSRVTQRKLNAPPPRAEPILRIDTAWARDQLRTINGTRPERLYAICTATKQILLPATHFQRSGELNLFSFAPAAPAAAAPSTSGGSRPAAAGVSDGMDVKHRADDKSDEKKPSAADPTPIATFVVPSTSVPIVSMHLLNTGRCGQLVCVGLASGEFLVWKRTGELIHWLFRRPIDRTHDTDQEESFDTSLEEREIDRDWRVAQADSTVFQFAVSSENTPPLLSTRRIPVLAVRALTPRPAVEADRLAHNQQSKALIGEGVRQWDDLGYGRFDGIGSECVLINLKDGGLSKTFYPYFQSSVSELSLVWLAPQPNAAGRIDPAATPKGYVLTAHYNGSAVVTDLNGQSTVLFDENDAPEMYRPKRVVAVSRGVTAKVTSARTSDRITSTVDTQRGVWTVRSGPYGIQYFNLHTLERVHSWWNPGSAPPPLPGIFSTHSNASHFFALSGGRLVGYSWGAPSTPQPLLAYGDSGVEPPSAWDIPPNPNERKFPTNLIGSQSTGHPIMTCAMPAGNSRFVACAYSTGGIELVDLYAHPADGFRQHEVDQALKLARQLDANGFRRGDTVQIVAGPNRIRAEAKAANKAAGVDDSDEEDDDEEEVVFVGTVVSIRHGAVCVQGFPIYIGSDLPTGNDLLALSKRAVQYAKNVERAKQHVYTQYQKDELEQRAALARAPFLLKTWRGRSNEFDGDVRWVHASSPLIRHLIMDETKPHTHAFRYSHPPPYHESSVVEFSLPRYGVSYADYLSARAMSGADSGYNRSSGGNLTDRQRLEAEEKAEQERIGRFLGLTQSEKECCSVRYVIGPYIVFRSSVLGTHICCLYDAEWVSKAKAKVSAAATAVEAAEAAAKDKTLSSLSLNALPPAAAQAKINGQTLPHYSARAAFDVPRAGSLAAAAASAAKKAAKSVKKR